MDEQQMTAQSDNERRLAEALAALMKVTSGSASDNPARIAMYRDAISFELDRIGL